MSCINPQFNILCQLELESNKLTEEARQLLRKEQRDRALLVLKVKKFKEKEVLNIDGKLLSVHEMIQNVEWEYSNMEVMKALRSGTDALNKMHEEMSIEDVESLLEETNEAIQVQILFFSLFILKTLLFLSN